VAMDASQVWAWMQRTPFCREVIQYARRFPVPTFLVGGTIRDALLGLSSKDIDLAVAGSAVSLARRLADELKGAFVPMDLEHDVARVVVRTSEGYYYIDLAGLRRDSIRADLLARDYTINAMALSLKEDSRELLDPAGGLEDLKRGLLRMVYDQAFHDDPLRVLRGLRLSAALGFEIESGTLMQMRQWAKELSLVSAERVRDELLAMLRSGNAAQAVARAEAIGILRCVLPGQICGEHVAQSVRVLTVLRDPLSAIVQADRDLAGVLGHGTAYREHLIRYWSKPVYADVSRWLLLKLAAFLMSVGRPWEANVGRAVSRLRLSRRGATHVCNILRAAGRIRTCAVDGGNPVTVYRFYKAVGDAGPSGLFLAWAMGAGGMGDATRCIADSFCPILRAWFCQREQFVSPRPLLSGREIIRQFGVSPGPQIGELLEILIEAQVAGKVTDREQALGFLEQFL